MKSFFSKGILYKDSFAEVIFYSSSVHIISVAYGNEVLFKKINKMGEKDLNTYSKTLLRFSALFALLGAFLGSHMAGAGDFNFLTVHAHILVVGWLTLFAWAVYYKIFTPANKMLATLHVWSAIIGAVGLTSGMWLRYVGPFGVDTDGTFSLIFFIVGGSILLLSFFFFALLTFMKTEEDN